MHILDYSVARRQACDLGSVKQPMQGRFGSELQEMAAWEGTDLLLRLVEERCRGGDSGIFPGLQS